jgi:hypothetical protein
VQIKILLSELPSRENNDSNQYFIAAAQQGEFKVTGSQGFLLSIQSVGEKSRMIIFVDNEPRTVRSYLDGYGNSVLSTLNGRISPDLKRLSFLY